MFCYLWRELQSPLLLPLFFLHDSSLHWPWLPRWQEASQCILHTCKRATAKILFIALITRNLHCQWITRSLSMDTELSAWIDLAPLPSLSPQGISFPWKYYLAWVVSMCSQTAQMPRALKKSPYSQVWPCFPSWFYSPLYLLYHHNNLLLLWEQGTAIVLHALR